MNNPLRYAGLAFYQYQMGAGEEVRAAGQPYVRGAYEVGGNQLYVNRGLGWGRKRSLLHRGSEPEVALFTLRRAPHPA